MTNCMEDAFKEAGVSPTTAKVSVTVINESAMKVIQAIPGTYTQKGTSATVKASHDQIVVHLAPGHMLVLDKRGMWHLRTEVTL